MRKKRRGIGFETVVGMGGGYRRNMIRNHDLTRGKPDLKSSKMFSRGECQQIRSLDMPTSIVYVREENPNINVEGRVFSIIDRF